MSFRGQYSISLDAKGRMAVPARFRTAMDEVCQGQLVVTLEQSGKALWIYPQNEFEEMERKVAGLSSFDPFTKGLQQIVIGHAVEVSLDSNGRILIPQNLRQFVGLDKRVALVGLRHKLELWDEDLWNATRDKLLKQELNIKDMPDELKNLSL